MDDSGIRANISSSRSMRITPVDSRPDVDDNNRPEEAAYDITNEQGVKEETAMMVMSGYPHEEWLPITESRKGNLYTCICHLLNSRIGFQALLLPVALKHLGWYWGISILTAAFGWQLYTSWLLVQLHESPTGTRYSRYLHLSMAAFGPKLGKILVLFPLMYLSGGTSVITIINVGNTVELFHRNVLCSHGHDICNSSTVLWYLVFVCFAITVAVFLPNLNSVACVSLIGAITGLCYCLIAWVFSLTKNQQHSSSHGLSTIEYDSDTERMMSIFGAIGIIAFSFRGHNLLLEIQGTLQANSRQKKTMWDGVRTGYLLIAALCLFPMAIGGYWAYGNQIPDGGILTAISTIHTSHNKQLTPLLGLIYILLIINSLCSYQIYAMPVFDNLELRWLSISGGGKPCTRLARVVIRLFFGGLTFFIALTFPFLPKLSALVGGIALPVTFAYPCFMWIAMEKPGTRGAIWWVNLVLGCSGVIVSALVVVSSVWNLVNHHFHANFFHPN